MTISLYYGHITQAGTLEYIELHRALELAFERIANAMAGDLQLLVVEFGDGESIGLQHRS